MKEYSVKDVCAAIEREIRKNDGIYFSYAWREKLGEFLEEESRYAKLVNWLNEQLELYGGTINTFSPADWSEEFEESYLKQIQRGDDTRKGFAAGQPLFGANAGEDREMAVPAFQSPIQRRV